MRKNNARSRIDRGMMFYAQKKCPLCRRLIVASDPKSFNEANRVLGRKLKAHSQEHQKEGKESRVR